MRFSRARTRPLRLESTSAGGNRLTHGTRRKGGFLMKWKGGIAFVLVATVGVVVVTTALARPSESTRASARERVPELRRSASPRRSPGRLRSSARSSSAGRSSRRSSSTRQFKTNFRIVAGRHAALRLALARTVGRRFVSNTSIIGHHRPVDEPGCDLERRAFKVASLAAVSGSATRTDLTTAGKSPDLLPGHPERCPSVADHRELRREHAEGEARGRGRLAGRLFDCPRERG